MSCSICFEDFCNSQIGGSTVTIVRQHQLANCQHQFCKPCLEQWFLQCKSNGPEGSVPTCPECRLGVHESDIGKVLIRPLVWWRNDDELEEQEEATLSTGISQDEDEESSSMDEFTRAYLEQEDVKQCPGCGAWIIKEDGCNNMMCRCGCRFCFCCGNVPNCLGSNFVGGTFYDNVLGCEEDEENLSSYGNDDAEQFPYNEYILETIGTGGVDENGVSLAWVRCLEEVFSTDEDEPHWAWVRCREGGWVRCREEPESSSLEPLFSGEAWEFSSLEPLFSGWAWEVAT
jgi:hypothetical protein